MKNIKWIAILLGLLLVLFLGWRVYDFVALKDHRHEEISSTVMLDRIREVTKVITVEGYFSEIYDYKDYYFVDILPLRKKALVRVKAKVSVGTDLTKSEMIADSDTKTITIKNVPPASILSIDHELDYYDLQDGVFNSFSEGDYNKLNAQAKDFIRTQALDSELMDMAEERLDTYLRFMESVIAADGWQIHWDQPSIPTQD